MPLPLFFVRRSARRRPANTRRLTRARYSSLRWNSSSKRSPSTRCAAFFSRRHGKTSKRLMGDLSRNPVGSTRGAEIAPLAPMLVRLGARGLGLALWQGLHDRVDHLVGFDALRLALEVEEHAVAKRGVRDGADVVDARGESLVHQRADLRGEEQRLPPTRRAAVADEAFGHVGSVRP